MKYDIEVTGMYGDWCKIKKGSIMLHDGASTIVDYSNDELTLSLNYGTRKLFTSTIRKYAGFYIAIPLEKEYIENQKVYPLLVFKEEELAVLTQVSYMNIDTIKLAKKCDNQDAITVLLCTINGRPKVTGFSELIDTFFSGIIYFEDDKVCVEDIRNCFLKNIEIIELNSRGCKKHAIYLQFDELVEWDVLLRINGKYFLQLDDEYAIFLKQLT